LRAWEIFRDSQIRWRYKIQLSKELIPQNILSRFPPQNNLEILAQEICQTPDRRPKGTKLCDFMRYVTSSYDKRGSELV